jgi:hypothetical protein
MQKDPIDHANDLSTKQDQAIPSDRKRLNPPVVNQSSIQDQILYKCPVDLDDAKNHAVR